MVDRLKKVQRAAARFVFAYYRRTTPVTPLINNIGWDSLHTRWLVAQNAMFFKIHHTLVKICMPPYFQPATFNKTRPSAQVHLPYFNNRCLQVLILPQKYPYLLESVTYNGNCSHNHISLQGYSPSSHQSAASYTRLKTSVAPVYSALCTLGSCYRYLLSLSSASSSLFAVLGGSLHLAPLHWL